MMRENFLQKLLVTCRVLCHPCLLSLILEARQKPASQSSGQLVAVLSFFLATMNLLCTYSYPWLSILISDCILPDTSFTEHFSWLWQWQRIWQHKVFHTVLSINDYASLSSITPYYVFLYWAPVLFKLTSLIRKLYTEVIGWCSTRTCKVGIPWMNMSKIFYCL